MKAPSIGNRSGPFVARPRGHHPGGMPRPDLRRGSREVHPDDRRRRRGAGPAVPLEPAGGLAARRDGLRLEGRCRADRRRQVARARRGDAPGRQAAPAPGAADERGRLPADQLHEPAGQDADQRLGRDSLCRHPRQRPGAGPPRREDSRHRERRLVRRPQPLQPRGPGGVEGLPALCEGGGYVPPVQRRRQRRRPGQSGQSGRQPGEPGALRRGQRAARVGRVVSEPGHARAISSRRPSAHPPTRPGRASSGCRSRA